MLDDRAKLLLKALVERYIAEGQPVGSRTLSRASGLDLSPATIRNVMSDLEDLGLIASPHTSAGRIPTARGYRLFVDTMLTAQREQTASARLVPDQPQKVIANAAHLLSNLSQFVGVVMAPRRTSVFRAHRIPAAVRTPLPGHHRLARRGRAEPRDLHRGRLHGLRGRRLRRRPSRSCSAASPDRVPQPGSACWPRPPASVTALIGRPARWRAGAAGSSAS